MKKGGYFIAIVLLILCVALAFLLRKEKTMDITSQKPIKTDINNVEGFDFKIINETNNLYNKQNYMISPLSIGYALSLLKEGASENTLKQIEDLLDNYQLKNSFAIKDRMSIANLIFIRNKYKNDVSKDYITLLKNKYNSEVLFDEFKTPKAINDWVKEKTYNMIIDPVQSISPDFILGLANAIAIDVEWDNKFECTYTQEKIFTKENGSKMKTAMMHSSDDVVYIESDDAKGIIKNYAIYDKTTGKRVYEENENTVALEYIAILPNQSIDSYISELNNKKLDELYKSGKSANDKLEIHYSIPKYTYDFDYDKFKEALIDLKITDAFDASKANFQNMKNIDSLINPYVSDAIHKTHIELSENGTKAAAVTIFMMKDSAIFEPEEKEKITINFDKPFIYIIKEKNNNNIWFFGTVYEPMKWDNNKDCDIK